MKTKQLLFVLAFIGAGSYTLKAQSDDRFSIGPRGGVNFSTITNVDNVESITGLVLGLTSTYSLNEHTGITLDVLYSSEGYKLPGEEAQLRYLQIPVYFDFFLGELGDRFRPKAYVGVAPAFFFGGKINEDDVIKKFWNKFLVSATGGVGFNYRLANRVWLNTDIRAYIGLSDVRHKDYVVGDALNPRTVQVSVGVAYGLSKL